MKSNKVIRSQAVMLERKARKEGLAIWRDAAQALSAPKSTETIVNISRLARIGDGKSPMFVPGKVLGTGPLDRKLIVGAFSFSESARNKIESAGGEALEIQEFVDRYPKGSGVLLVK
ncbi:MAG: 50S ribosomal protein L18e [Nitrososphaerota archaeon]|nr:50S ribosomal protein L18e [Nitrososphaerota archaeon]